MALHIKRSDTAGLDTLKQYDGIRTTRWERPPSGLSVREIQTTHTPTALQKLPEGKNYLTPPYHWHWYQEEFFHVKAGRYIFTLEGKDMAVSASDPQPVRIPPKARHTFKVDETHEGPCSIEITTAISPHSSLSDPEANGASEKFFRNLYTYLDDCWLQDKEPSVPQLLLMLDAAEISMAFPWGPDWLMRTVTYSLGVVIGRWFGGYILGYKASYPEYYDEQLATKRK